MEPWARKDRIGGKTPSSFFEEKYSTANESELRQAAARASREARELCRSILEERHALGHYAERRLDPVRGYSAHTESGAPVARVMIGPPASPGAVRFVWIPYNEHPEYYELNDEHAWLSKHVQRLDQGVGAE